MIAAAAGIVLGQRGRGAPAVVVRGVTYHHSDTGVISELAAPGRFLAGDGKSPRTCSDERNR